MNSTAWPNSRRGSTHHHDSRTHLGVAHYRDSSARLGAAHTTAHSRDSGPTRETHARAGVFANESPFFFLFTKLTRALFE